MRKSIIRSSRLYPIGQFDRYHQLIDEMFSIGKWLVGYLLLVSRSEVPIATTNETNKILPTKYKLIQHERAVTPLLLIILISCHNFLHQGIAHHIRLRQLAKGNALYMA